MVLIIFIAKTQAQQDSVKAVKPSLSTAFVLDTSNIKIETKSLEYKTDSTKEEIQTKVKKDWKPSPTVATCLSAAIPGLGQIYNRKYWKVPIVYAGLGASAFMIYYFHNEYVYYRTEYRLRMNPSYDLTSAGIVSTPNPKLATMNTENVYSYENSNRRYMELSIIALSVFYILNIVDATVDAHLTGFNVTDDLSLQVFPSTNNSYTTFSYAPTNLGVTLHFNF